jgi:hypothetical protein
MPLVLTRAPPSPAALAGRELMRPRWWKRCGRSSRARPYLSTPSRRGSGSAWQPCRTSVCATAGGGRVRRGSGGNAVATIRFSRRRSRRPAPWSRERRCPSRQSRSVWACRGARSSAWRVRYGCSVRLTRRRSCRAPRRDGQARPTRYRRVKGRPYAADAVERARDLLTGTVLSQVAIARQLGVTHGWVGRLLAPPRALLSSPPPPPAERAPPPAPRGGRADGFQAAALLVRSETAGIPGPLLAPRVEGGTGAPPGSPSPTRRRGASAPGSRAPLSARGAGARDSLICSVGEPFFGSLPSKVADARASPAFSEPRPAHRSRGTRTRMLNIQPRSVDRVRENSWAQGQEGGGTPARALSGGGGRSRPGRPAAGRQGHHPTTLENSAATRPAAGRGGPARQSRGPAARGPGPARRQRCHARRGYFAMLATARERRQECHHHAGPAKVL